MSRNVRNIVNYLATSPYSIDINFRLTNYIFPKLWDCKKDYYYEYPFFVSGDFIKNRKRIVSISIDNTRDKTKFKSIGPQLEYALNFAKSSFIKFTFDNKTYYVNKGSIFDAELEPLLFLTKVYGEFQERFILQNIKAYISPQIILNKGKIEKYIKDKIIPYMLTYGITDNYIVPEIVVKDISSQFITPDVKDVIEDYTMNSTLKDNINLILEDIPYEQED